MKIPKTPGRQSGREQAGADIPCLKNPPSVKTFQKAVLDYYRLHGRDLAWRKTSDPYAIMVSEIMLQQTQVERVGSKFPAFMETFPDFRTLAAASLADILLIWQGMGYNRRAIALQKCARKVIDEHGGRLPPDPEILATFPGIGRATASSICAFAFGIPVVFIETNIRRVFIHYFFQDTATVDDRDLLPLVEKTLCREDPRTWYNALMDLGTDLRKATENPNRRSRQYTRQTAFEGSDRKIRGEILRMLLTKTRCTCQDIACRYDGDADRIEKILCDLEREGFITRCGDRYSPVSS
ncbi:MAG: G/T mismatches repair enzyme [Methanoregula sp. PtaU1.Bin006]|uniref:A/G-specific adenine glycosylase n=1 Tax=Methanoregula sp. PtaU1.Bin006 TaxID=1811681 RepID=UPI0009D4E84D|nr:A/G-specific adenine glycosylase [Methanoregula sp. PtaU1.Bin006]OPY35222.1 MAG: G/T mismatches repair enzyme [Methanoregula sp. PtaU1.Bin006]